MMAQTAFSPPVLLPSSFDRRSPVYPKSGMAQTAFSPPVLLPSSFDRRSPVYPKSGSARCTAAPERTGVSKQSLPKHHRFLPKNLPVSERPPPVPRHHSIPFIGLFVEEFLGVFDKNPFVHHETYGPIFSSNYFLTDNVYLSDYDATMEILNQDVAYAVGDAQGNSTDLFGEGVISFLDGKDHQVARAVLAPAFSPALFPHYLKRAVNRTEETWRRVEDTVKKDGSVKFDPIFREHYLALTIEITTGVECDSERSSHIRNLFSDFWDSIILPKFMPGWKRGQAAKEEIRAILREVILENLFNRSGIINKLREYGGDIVKLGIKDIANGDVNILLITIANSTLSTNKNEPLDEELIASLGRNMILLWFAGFITTSITSTCASFELGFREDLLARLVKEQDEIGETEVTYEQVMSQMPLLDAFFMEIIRIYPSAAVLWRRTTSDTEILGKFVPKGSRLFLNLTAPQRSNENYRDAQAIIPERWFENPKPKPILSFGAPGSPHYCIGAGFAKIIFKVTFASLLRGYEFKLDPKQSRKYRNQPDNTPESRVRVIKFERRPEIREE